jgi:hypothetical protein
MDDSPSFDSPKILVLENGVDVLFSILVHTFFPNYLLTMQDKYQVFPHHVKCTEFQTAQKNTVKAGASSSAI